MGIIVLITGGGRSGKSSYAQRLVEGLPSARAYIATTTPFDEELRDRVARHRESRSAEVWSATVEEPLALAGAIREAARFPSVLVDCLTMWVGNLMWAAENGGRQGPAPVVGVAPGAVGSVPAACAPPTDAGAAPAGAVLTEGDLAVACGEIVSACREHQGTVVLITNEVGLGIIPDNPAARLYRDLLGRCNQLMAAAADIVVLMVSGLPLILKGRDRLEALGGADAAELAGPSPPGGAKLAAPGPAGASGSAHLESPSGFEAGPPGASRVANAGAVELGLGGASEGGSGPARS